MSATTASSSNTDGVLRAELAEGVVPLPRGRTRFHVVSFNEQGGAFFLNGWQNTPFALKPAEILVGDFRSLIDDVVGKGLLPGPASQYTVSHPQHWTAWFDIRKWGDTTPLLRLQAAIGQDYRHVMQTDQIPSGML